MQKPAWRRIAERVGGDALGVCAAELDPREPIRPNAVIPQLAVFHLDACLNAGIEANAALRPTVAMCLLRQCVESLTIIDVGLQPSAYRDFLLDEWHKGNKTTGALRKDLEREVWPRYGPGIWDEPWSEYFSNLAWAVHPYAHYSPQLQGWQMSFVASPISGREPAHPVVVTGPRTFEPVKIARISLLQCLVIYTLARLLLVNRPSCTFTPHAPHVERLRSAIASSKLLCKTKNWADELTPYLWFLPGKDWLDDA